MRALADAFLDLVSGSSCVGCATPGRLWCGDCESLLPRAATQVRPRPCPPGLAPAYATTEYADPVAAMVVGHKEHRQLALVAPLGRLLATAVEGLLGGPVPTLLVPVPSRRSTVAGRGHDPLLRVVRRTAGLLTGRGHRVRCAPLLVARERVRDQAGLGSAERAVNLAGSMWCPDARLRRWAGVREPVRVVVCDDVLTTGATTREAQRALEVSGVRVAGIATVAATRRRVAPGGVGGE